MTIVRVRHLCCTRLTLLLSAAKSGYMDEGAISSSLWGNAGAEGGD